MFQTLRMSLTATAILLSTAGLATHAMAEEVEITTAAGPVKVAAAPKTIVALDIPAVDTLHALGVPIAAVPGKLYVSYLGDVAASAKPAGTLQEPDLEVLAGIAPDLIIAGGRSQKQVPALAQVAPTVDMTIDGTDIAQETLSRIATYGTLFGKEAEAAELSRILNEKIAAARAAAANKGDALVVLTNGPKVSAYGPGSRFGWVHSVLGLPPAVPDIAVAGHGEAISFEYIRDADPDWLIVIDRAAAIGQEGENAAQTLDNALVKETKAWKAGHVVYLDGADAYISAGGYTSLSRLLDQVTEAFGPSTN